MARTRQECHDAIMGIANRAGELKTVAEGFAKAILHLPEHAFQAVADGLEELEETLEEEEPDFLRG